MRFRYSYAETMQVPHSAALAMRGCRPRAKPHGPSSLHSCAATVLNVGVACPAARSATWRGGSSSSLFLHMQLVSPHAEKDTEGKHAACLSTCRERHGRETCSLSLHMQGKERKENRTAREAPRSLHMQRKTRKGSMQLVSPHAEKDTEGKHAACLSTCRERHGRETCSLSLHMQGKERKENRTAREAPRSLRCRTGRYDTQP